MQSCLSSGFSACRPEMRFVANYGSGIFAWPRFAQLKNEPRPVVNDFLNAIYARYRGQPTSSAREFEHRSRAPLRRVWPAALWSARIWRRGVLVDFNRGDRRGFAFCTVGSPASHNG